MDRRSFISVLAAGALAPVLLGAKAQPAGKVYRIGCLSLNPIDPSSPGIFEGFLRGLRERGWVVGHNVTLEYRNGGGRAERLRDAAQELVALNVDLIVAWGVVDIRAAMQATRTIPIVMGVHSGDPGRIRVCCKPCAAWRERDGSVTRRRRANIQARGIAPRDSARAYRNRGHLGPCYRPG